MSADMILHQPQAIERGFNSEQIDLIKRTICKDATDDELQLFIGQCQRTGLDPFAKQIHALKRNAKDSSGKWIQTLSIQIGIDGFRLIADRTERYVPGKEPLFRYDEQGRLLSATAYVMVWRRDRWHEVPATALYDEYVQTNNSGAPVSMWKKMPHSQLAKCAESLALRKAFPAELSGLYTSDEMAQADNSHTPQTYQPTAAGTVNTQTGEIVETQTKAIEAKPADLPTADIETWEPLREAAMMEWAKRKYNAEALSSVLNRPIDEPCQVKNWNGEIIRRSGMYMTFFNLTDAELHKVEKALQQTNSAYTPPVKAAELYTPEQADSEETANPEPAPIAEMPDDATPPLMLVETSAPAVTGNMGAFN